MLPHFHQNQTHSDIFINLKSFLVLSTKLIDVTILRFLWGYIFFITWFINISYWKIGLAKRETIFKSFFWLKNVPFWTHLILIFTNETNEYQKLKQWLVISLFKYVKQRGSIVWEWLCWIYYCTNKSQEIGSRVRQ